MDKYSRKNVKIGVAIMECQRPFGVAAIVANLVTTRGFARKTEKCLMYIVPIALR